MKQVVAHAEGPRFNPQHIRLKVLRWKVLDKIAGKDSRQMLPV